MLNRIGFQFSDKMVEKVQRSSRSRERVKTLRRRDDQLQAGLKKLDDKRIRLEALLKQDEPDEDELAQVFDPEPEEDGDAPRLTKEWSAAARQRSRCVAGPDRERAPPPSRAIPE